MSNAMIEILFSIIDLDYNNELTTDEFELLSKRDYVGMKNNDTLGLLKNKIGL
eukprot:CAMPEP_0116939872 /NCGR_PEP_ID=MMETSP0467-20121206/33013_1 /TAXON_ID=283647 /ORGANISM="Mesodinium pulex, Strain SPMC105" /LENGTH=52 /DNA_ID=CAMNT_0004622271 /DNA_START=926 /DNA_END=1084 /DNA_ORIENTATION=-